MADSVIGAIRAILSMDTAAFTSGSKEAQNALSQLDQKFSATAKKLAAGLGIGVGVQQFVASLTKAIDAADALNKASQKFGVPVEQLSGLKFAADLADVSMESLGKGLGKLSKAMLEGLTNPSSEAAKSFKALGVSIKDSNGNLRNTEDVFLDVADKFANMEDGAAKTAMAIRVFGKSGADLIPLLNAGRDGLRAMIKEAKELGLVISAETAMKAEQFNDTLKKLHASSDVLYLKIAQALLPGLLKIANAFLVAKGEGEGMNDLMVRLGQTFESDVEDIQRIIFLFEAVTKVWTAFSAVRTADITKTGELSGAWEKFKKTLEEVRLGWVGMQASFAPTGMAGAFDSLDNLNQQVEKVRRGVTGLDDDALRVKQSIDKWIESQKRQAEAQTAANQVMSGAAGIMEANRFQSELDNKLIDEKTKLIGEQIQKANEAKQAIIFQAQTAELKRFVEEGKSDWDKYIEKLDELKARMEQFPAQNKDLTKTLEKTQRDMINIIAGNIATALGGFSQLFMAAAGSNKRLFEIGKAFAIAEATVNTFKAANQALTAPPGPPFSYIYVAGAIAAGIANVIKITQTKFTAAALGGRFRVPGGSMGVDTGIFPLKLAPGELVEVTPSSRAGGAGDSILNIPAVSPRDFFTGDTVRYMVESIDKWMRDGGTGIRMVPR